MGKKLKSLFKRIFQFICYCDGVFGPDLNPGKPDCLIIPDFLVIDELNEAPQEEIDEINRLIIELRCKGAEQSASFILANGGK